MHHHNFAVSASMRQKYPFMSLLSPLTGVVGSVYPLEPQEMHIPAFRRFWPAWAICQCHIPISLTIKATTCKNRACRLRRR